jgi:prepilin-type N-terminal cleavage/methylation domain-containing protein
MLYNRIPHDRAMTLIEVSIAMAISALFLGSLFTMNSQCIAMIRMAREAACASQVLQQRVEALRIANWHQITDADWVSNNIMNADVAGASSLKNETETLTLIPYGSSTPGNTQLQRPQGGICTIVNRNDALLAENAIKVLLQVDFSSAPNNRAVTRQTVAILAKGGVAKW